MILKVSNSAKSNQVEPSVMSQIKPKNMLFLSPLEGSKFHSKVVVR